MLAKIVRSGGSDYIGLFPLEYGWWLVTRFTRKKQEVLVVLEDNWAKLWPERGWPMEIKVEDHNGR